MNELIGLAIAISDEDGFIDAASGDETLWRRHQTGIDTGPGGAIDDSSQESQQRGVDVPNSFGSLSNAI